MATYSEVEQVLIDAANTIHEGGWATRHGRGDDWRFWDRHARTLLEAVEYVVPWNGKTPTAVFALLRLRAGADDLDAWNEEPSRTINEVLALLNPDWTREIVSGTCFCGETHRTAICRHCGSWIMCHDEPGMMGWFAFVQSAGTYADGDCTRNAMSGEHA